MADVILKNINGENVVYEDVTKVSLDTADGGIATFTLGGDGSITSVDYAQSNPNADDYIKNRPFYEDNISIEWDGVCDDSAITGDDPMSGTMTLQLVSEVVYTQEELNKFSLTYMNPNDGRISTSLINSDDVRIEELGDVLALRVYQYGTGYILWVAPKDGAKYTLANGITKITFPKKGIYFAHVRQDNVSQQVRAVSLNGSILKKMDEKFLPDSVAMDADVVSTIANAIVDKVDKVSGKGLSTNDFTNSYKETLDTLQIELNNGKNLSTNDFTNEYKEKIDSSQQVQSDYNQSNSTEKNYIKNRPFSEDYWAILDETTKFATNSVDNPEFTVMFWFKLNGALIKDRNYDIYLDEKSYRLTCNRYTTSDNTNILIIGNAYLAFQLLDLTTTDTVVNTGESFAIMQDENTESIVWVNFDETEQTIHDIKLVLNDIKKIDKKFLPDDIVGEVTNGLPDVTTSDNGKILKVINGTWQLANDETGTGGSNSGITSEDKEEFTQLIIDVSFEEALYSNDSMTFSFHENTQAYTWFSGGINSSVIDFIEGETYFIEWDGKIYKSIAESHQMDGKTYHGIGNGSMLGVSQNTGEPFVFVNVIEYAQNVFISNDTEESTHAVTIYQKKESSLPKVNTNDNNKILKVIDGKWQLSNYEISMVMNEVELYPKREFVTSLDADMNMYVWLDPAECPCEIIAGEEYYVEFDGNVYNLIGKEMSLGMLSGVGLGNASIVGIGENTGEPFIAGYVPKYDTLGLYIMDSEETTHTIRIYQLKESSSAEFNGTISWNNITDNPLVNETIVLTEKFSENDLAFTYISDFEMAGWNVQENRFSFIQKGKEYIVNFDGTEYKCIAKEVTSNNITGLYLGNLSIANIPLNATNENTGEPFMIDNLNHYAEISTKDTEDTTHTVSISSEEIKYELIQLDWDETDQSSPAYIKNKPIIAADGSVTVQSNWNQSDNTQGDYIKNRPFYDYTVEENIFNQTVEGFTFQEEFNSYMVATKPAPFVLKIDKEYIVTFDGEEFTLTPFYFEFNGYTHVCVGDKALTGVPSTGEEFAIVYNEATDYINYFSFSTATSHTISIIEKGIEVKQIDEKYIPESARGIQPDWSIDDTTSKSHILNRPFYGKEVEVLPLITCDMATTNEPQCGFDMSHSFLEDNSYKVFWDGVEYICPVQKIEEDGASPMYALGNLYELVTLMKSVGETVFIDETTLLQNNEPFFIACEENEGSKQYSVGDVIKYKEILDALINTGDASSVVCVNHTLKINHLNIEKTLDPIYLPSNLQVDWNYLKNKPFYKETEKTPLLNNITFNFIYDGELFEGSDKGLSGYQSTLPENTVALINNPKYNKVEIIIDGTLYESELQYYSGMRCAGNMQIMLGSGDTGEPFVIASQDTMFMIMYLNETTNHEIDEEIPHTVSLTLISENIKKIDSQFVYQADWNEMNKKSGSYIKNKPFGLKGDLLLDMNVVAIQRQEQSGFIMNIGLGQYVGLVVGETYTVSIDDGEKYVLVAESSGENTIILSNAGSDYFEGAFMLQESLSESMMGLMWLVDSSSASTSCNLKIYKGTVEIQKIPIEYLPDDIGGMPNASAEDEGKFMRVIGGQAVWATVLNAEEVKF